MNKYGPLPQAELETMARECAEARQAYDAWMEGWRERHGHAGKPYDPDTGVPLKEAAP